MSIEYTGKLTPELSDEHVEMLIQKISEIQGLNVLVKTSDELRTGLVENMNPEQEAIKFIVKSDQVYVGFHVCNRNQRDRILELISLMIRDSGSECEFNEE
ncbi:hypothetical protein [Gimesia panareensis]|uniref:hypothetical protein n=1 Tax=Gimesia panareensis TaxID=2527978 RepID=UPI00118D1FB1|nr:hypothetical protein [Gimesia panareensis]QDU49582.1 hypothetical protein Pan110_19200 [Gimesia panareensis]